MGTKEKIKAYLSENLKKGYSLDSLTGVLIKEGYDRKDIDEVARRLNHRINPLILLGGVAVVAAIVLIAVLRKPSMEQDCYSTLSRLIKEDGYTLPPYQSFQANHKTSENNDTSRIQFLTKSFSQIPGQEVASIYYNGKDKFQYCYFQLSAEDANPVFARYHGKCVRSGGGGYYIYSGSEKDSNASISYITLLSLRGEGMIKPKIDMTCSGYLGTES